MLAKYFPSAKVAAALCVLLCAGAAACDYGVGPISTFGIRCDSGQTQVSSLAFIPADTMRLSMGRSDSVEVRALDSQGASGSFCSPPLSVVSAAPTIAEAVAHGRGIVRFRVLGVSPGTTVLRASSGGRTDSLTIVVRQ